jgi:hypothetical protein
MAEDEYVFTSVRLHVAQVSGNGAALNSSIMSPDTTILQRSAHIQQCSALAGEYVFVAITAHDSASVCLSVYAGGDVPSTPILLSARNVTDCLVGV